VAVGHGEVGQVSAAGFGHAQRVESQQTGQHVIDAASQAGLDQERTELAAVETEAGGLLGDLRSSDVHRRECSSSCSSTQ
jgi:hypothetical protein